MPYILIIIGISEIYTSSKARESINIINNLLNHEELSYSQELRGFKFIFLYHLKYVSSQITYSNIDLDWVGKCYEITATAFFMGITSVGMILAENSLSFTTNEQ